MIVRYGSLSGARFTKLVREQVTVIVPCAPLEVHGPHLSLATDIILEFSRARARGRRLRTAGGERGKGVITSPG